MVRHAEVVSREAPDSPVAARPRAALRNPGLKTKNRVFKLSLIELNFDGNLHATQGTASAKLGAGARFIDSVEGKGVEPGDGAAATIAVPDASWRSAATLAFRFRPSRTLRFAHQLSPVGFLTRLFQARVLRKLMHEHRLIAHLFVARARFFSLQA